MDLIVKFIALIVAVVIHEVAHGYAAYLLGDPTAKRAHRLTLNPLAHLDIFGSIVLPVVLVITNSPVLLGWAKPVPFNPGYFKDPRRGIMIVGAAGPLTNFIAALISAVIFRFVAPLPHLVAAFLFFFCATNLILGIFNLIPIPPLDGSRIVMGILPDNLLPAYMRLEAFGFIIIFALLLLGVLDYVVAPIYQFLIVLLLAPG
jgi:Zn-dependent protease